MMNATIESDFMMPTITTDELITEIEGLLQKTAASSESFLRKMMTENLTLPTCS